MRSRSQNAQPLPEIRFLRSRADTMSDVALQCPERAIYALALTVRSRPERSY